MGRTVRVDLVGPDCWTATVFTVGPDGVESRRPTPREFEQLAHILRRRDEFRSYIDEFRPMDRRPGQRSRVCDLGHRGDDRTVVA